MIGSVYFSLKVPKAKDKITIYRPNINGLGLYLIKIIVISIRLLTSDYKYEHFYYSINVDILYFKKDKIRSTSVLLNKDEDLQGL